MTRKLNAPLDDDFEDDLLTEDDAGTESTDTSNDIEIEIEDDTPEQDRGKPRRPEGQEPEVPSDDELANYSDSVRKRIQKLRYEFHEERRAKEEAKRIEQQALAFAQQQRAEVERLRTLLEQGRGELVTQAKGRIESQLAQAKLDFKNAYEAGDADAMVTAQQKLIQLQAESTQYARAVAQAMQPPAQPRPAPQPQPQQAPRPQPSQAALSWAQRNQWFGSDQVMTAVASAAHNALVAEGVELDSKVYYARIDAEMRKRFPEKFGDDGATQKPPRRAAQLVAPAQRSGATATRVKLTESELRMAKKLGLTPQQYAAEKLKGMRTND
jgi:hypothetical protein